MQDNPRGRGGLPPLPGGRRTLHTSITIEQEETLHLIARRRGATKAVIVREALDAYFASFFSPDSRNNQPERREHQREPAA